MTPRKLSNWFDTYLEYTSLSEPPKQFHQWVAISVINSALQRKCYLMWDEPTYPNMYICIVGPSGCRKGTALRFGRDLIDALDNIKLANDAGSPRALINRLEDSHTIDTDENGDTVEHSSLTIYSPELAVFLGYENRQLINYLTDWFDCRDPWIYETQHMGHHSVSATWVNLLGAITPSLLQDTMVTQAIGGGLTSRIVFVYGADKARLAIFPHLDNLKVAHYRDDLIYDLSIIKSLQGEFKVSEETIEVYSKWYVNGENNKPIKDPRFDGYLQRRPKHMLKTAMALSAAESNNMVIEVRHMNKAIELLESAEKLMPMTYQAVGKNDLVGLFNWLQNDLIMEKESTVNTLFARYHREYDGEQLRRALLSLQKMGKIKFEMLDNAQHGDKKVIWTGGTENA